MMTLFRFIMENPEVAFLITLSMTMIVCAVIIGYYYIIETIFAVAKVVRNLVLYEMFNLNSRHNKNKGV